MAQTQLIPARSRTPFSKSYKDINIVNNNYNHYGNSVLPNYSKSILTQHPSYFSYSQNSTTHSIRSGWIGHHGGDLDQNQDPDPLDGDESFVLLDEDGQADSGIVELNSNNFNPRIKSKFSYRSLIPDAKVKRFLNRLDPDSFSLFSTKSTHQRATIKDLPIEVMKQIISYVQDDQKTLVNCLYVNKQFYKVAKPQLYFDPFLTSTYRVAQLITSLRQFPENGLFVRKLDLSNLKPGNLEIDEDQPQASDSSSSINVTDDELNYAHASWRDWKYRGDPLYGSSMLNSYNLSKSKSSTSVNSLSSTSSFKLKMNLRYIDEMNTKFKHLGNKIWKFKKPGLSDSNKKRRRSSASSVSTTSRFLSTRSKLKRTIDDTKLLNDENLEDKDSSSLKQVRIHFRNPKSQPFIEKHPYTNKFLLKYATSNDIPIGYILYFIDLCPYLIDLNLSKISLSTDFKIVYPEPSLKFSSLVEDVLSLSNNTLAEEQKLLPLFLSDSNVYFNVKTFRNQFVKLWESDIILKLCQLEHLENLNLSSISWLNFKSLREFKKNSKSLTNQKLNHIDLNNSGMIRNLNWAMNFNDIEEFNTYFQNDHEPEVPQEENVMRNVGMNY